MIPLTIASLEEHLKSLNYSPIFQKETNQLIVVLKIDKQEFPLFFRIYEGGELLQFIVFIPSNIKAKAVSDLARLLHLVNKEVDLPGFGMDEKAGIVYYRYMLPAIDGNIDGNLVASLCSSIKTLCESFSAVIIAVAVGAATYDDVLKKLAAQSP